MGWQFVARTSVAICLTFEERIVPRCSVVKLMLLKGLVKKDLNLISYFMCLNQRDFMDKYVIKYQDEVPLLLDLYQGKVSLMELEFGS